MNIHFFQKHKLITLTLLFLFSSSISLVLTSALLIFISHDYSMASALATWSFGIISAIAGLYYFLVDQKRDLNVLFERIERNNKIFARIQCFNDSKVGTVVSPKIIYVTPNVPNANSLIQDYKNDTDYFTYINISQFSPKNFADFFPLSAYQITPELLIPWDELLKQISSCTKDFFHGKNCQLQSYNKCYLTIVFCDSKDSPYLFTYSLGNDAIHDINSQL